MCLLVVFSVCNSGALGGQHIVYQHTRTYTHFYMYTHTHATPSPPKIGIMPIVTAGGFERMTGFCKTYIPQHIADKMTQLKGDEAAVKVCV